MLSKQGAQQIKRGRSLITKEDIVSQGTVVEGEMIQLQSAQGSFVAYAYAGVQHKGIGWVFSRIQTQSSLSDVVESIVQQAIQKRKHLIHSLHTTAFRLFHAEGDGLGGVTIDWYDGYAVISWYSPGAMTVRELFVQALIRFLPQMKGIYEKYRFNHPDKKESQHVWGQTAPEPHIIVENGIRYATYLDEGWMTGIFLDQREVREEVTKRSAKWESVLNTFSYTGAFSVAASMGGAKQTVSVDVAKRSLHKTQEHFLLNELPVENQLIYVMDVFDYIKYAMKKKLQFDCVIADPPSFARTKKRTFSVLKDYASLVEQLATLVKPNGFFIVSTNASQLSKAQFQQMIEKGMKNAGRKYHIQKWYTQPEDFPFEEQTEGSQYLKVCFIRCDE